jgi:hypothetical protein
VSVDFAPPPRWPDAVAWGVAALLGIGVGLVAFSDVRQWQALSAARNDGLALQRQLDERQAQRAALSASAAALPTFAPDAARRLATASFDTPGVLRSIESARVPGVRVIAVEVDADGRRAEIQLDVANADVASAYLQALNAGLDTPTWTLSRLQVSGNTETALIVGRPG